MGLKHSTKNLLKSNVNVSEIKLQNTKRKLFANFFFCYQTDTLLLCFQTIRFIYMSHLHLN